jgi:hypothetical protein
MPAITLILFTLNNSEQDGLAGSRVPCALASIKQTIEQSPASER